MKILDERRLEPIILLSSVIRIIMRFKGYLQSRFSVF